MDDEWETDHDFCLLHGYEHMKTDQGPIPYCAECDREKEAG